MKYTQLFFLDLHSAIVRLGWLVPLITLPEPSLTVSLDVLYYSKGIFFKREIRSHFKLACCSYSTSTGCNVKPLLMLSAPLLVDNEPLIILLYGVTSDTSLPYADAICYAYLKYLPDISHLLLPIFPRLVFYPEQFVYHGPSKTSLVDISGIYVWYCITSFLFFSQRKK